MKLKEGGYIGYINLKTRILHLLTLLPITAETIIYPEAYILLELKSQSSYYNISIINLGEPGQAGRAQLAEDGKLHQYQPKLAKLCPQLQEETLVK